MTDTARKYRVALVGCGDIAEKGHVPALLAHERFELAAVCDVRPQRAALLSRMAGGVEALQEYRPLLDRPDLDAVVLALHPEVSIEVAIAFLRAGKAVLDEKPLATNLDDGRRLVRAVEDTRGVYQIGFVFGYCALVRNVGELARRIGRPALYRVGIYDERLDPANREHFERISGILRHSTAITHEGSHVVDYARLWHAEPHISVHARAVRTDASFPGPNLWTAHYAWADGSTLELDIAWFVPELPASELSILGPRGALRIELLSGRGELRIDGRVETVQVGPLVQPWARQLDAFAASIDRGESAGAPVTRGWEALLATQAAVRSAQTGEVVRLDELR